MESERTAGSDQEAEGVGAAPDSASEGEESEDEELLLLGGQLGGAGVGEGEKELR